MRASGDVLSYLEMCQEEGVNLQQGMNFRLRGGPSVILMSVRAGAPYADQVQDGGRVLVYEGHDRPRLRGGPDPKTLDQELTTPAGSPTQNGLFYEAARRAHEGTELAEMVRVYEKVRTGIWVFNVPHGLGRDAEILGDLTVRPAADEHQEDLELTLR